jgi:diguanylate cyclase (GGDEF)-like protein
MKAEGNLLKINTRLEKLAYTDPLTGLLNRRRIIKDIESAITRFERDNETFVIVLADIDNFKLINDTYGHDCGDVFLVKISNVIKSVLRQSDRVARWGGEEFIILLTDITLEDGRRVAEKIRKKLRETIIVYDNTPISVTMTFGISEYNERIDLSTLINRADQCLYKGKEMGKDITIC